MVAFAAEVPADPTNRQGTIDPINVTDSAGSAEQTAPRQRRMGLGGKMLLVMITLAATTVAASLTGWFNYTTVRQSIVGITGGSLPTMLLARELAAESAAIAAGGPVLATATTQLEREAALSPLIEHRDRLLTILDELEQRTPMAADIAVLRRLVLAMAETLDRQNRNASRRLTLAARHEALANQLVAYHESFLEVLTPLRERAGANLVNATEGLRGAVEHSVRTLTVDLNTVQFAVLELLADSHLSVALMLRVLDEAGDPDLARLFSDYVGTTTRMTQQIQRLEQAGHTGTLRAPIEALFALGVGPDSVFVLTRKRQATAAGSGERADFDRRLDAVRRQVHDAHQRLVAQLTPTIYRVRGDIFRVGAQLNRKADGAVDRLLTQGIGELRTLLELASVGTLIGGLLNEAINVPQPSRVDILRGRFGKASTELGTLLATLEDRPGFDALIRLGRALSMFGQGGDTDLFELRRGELTVAAEGAALLDVNRQLAHELGATVRRVVATAQTVTETDTARATASLDRTLFELSVMAVVSLVVALLVAWLYIGRQIVQPLTRLAATTRRIAAGDVTAEIHRLGSDEIADMVDALVVFRDATVQLGERTEALRRSEERFRQLLETSPVGVSILTRDLKTRLYANPSFLRMFGYRDYADAHSQGTRPTWENEADLRWLLGEIRNSGSIDGVEMLRRRMDGSRWWNLLHVRYLEFAGQEAIIAWHYDITERKYSEEAQRQARQEAERALAELKATQSRLIEAERLASLGGIVAGVAHEINTPVGIALTGTSMLEEKVADLKAAVAENRLRKSDFNRFIDGAEEVIRLILSNIGRAAELVQSFKKVAVDQASDERRRFWLKSYLDEVAISLRPTWKRAGHTLTISCPEDIEVDGYPGAISQIVTNFVVNSVVHAYDVGQNGSLSLTVERKSAGTLIMTYADDGRGIPEAHRRRVFDPFFTTRRSHGSTGLGLNIVFNIVTGQLGGRIALDSEVGRGTRFILEFPRVLAGTPPPSFGDDKESAALPGATEPLP